MSEHELNAIIDRISDHLTAATQLMDQLRQESAHLQSPSQWRIPSLQHAQHHTSIAIGTERYARIPYQGETYLPFTCADCGTEDGHYHIIGCSKELCPKCLDSPFLDCPCYALMSQVEQPVV